MKVWKKEGGGYIMKVRKENDIKNLSIIEETLYGGYMNINSIQVWLSNDNKLKGKPIDYLLEKRNEIKGKVETGVANSIHLSPGIRFLLIDCLHDIGIEKAYVKKSADNDYLILDISYENCCRSLRFQGDLITYAFRMKSGLDSEFVKQFENSIILRHTFEFLSDGTYKLGLVLFVLEGYSSTKGIEATREIIFEELIVYEKI